MLNIVEESAWTFDTSGTGGIGIEFVAVQGGLVYLKDPRHMSVRFRLLAAGVGVTYGLKLPKLGHLPTPKIRGKSVGGAAAPTFFPNAGKIWKTAACPGTELTHHDFCGPVVYIEGGGSLIAVAGTVDLMLLGFDKLAYAEAMAGGSMPVVGTMLTDRALSTVKAVLVCAGVSATYGTQLGIAVMTGAIW